MSDLEAIFNLYIQDNKLIISKAFLQEQLRYYKEVLNDEHNPKVIGNEYIINNFDKLLDYCKLHNIEIAYPDLTFKVNGWNC